MWRLSGVLCGQSFPMRSNPAVEDYDYTEAGYMLYMILGDLAGCYVASDTI